MTNKRWKLLPDFDIGEFLMCVGIIGILVAVSIPAIKESNKNESATFGPAWEEFKAAKECQITDLKHGDPIYQCSNGKKYRVTK